MISVISVVNDLKELRDRVTQSPARTTQTGGRSARAPNVTHEARMLPGTRTRRLPLLFEQIFQILKHGVFFVRARAISDKELLAQVQCFSLHYSGIKPIPYRSQELISVPLIFSRGPCVINRSRIELIEGTFGSQLNFATVSVINLSSARKTKSSAYMQ